MHGELKGQFAITYNTDSEMPLVIGTNTDNRNDEYFNGIIDEVSIWSSALSLKRF